MNLYPALVGTTLIVDDGTEDVLLDYDAAEDAYLSETRRWDTEGREVLTGDTDQAVLCAKHAFAWKVQFTGYGRDLGSFVPLELRVSDQRLAARLARDYNARVAGMEPEGPDSFLHCGYGQSVVLHQPDAVWDDAEAEAIWRSGVILDRAWRRETEPSPRP